MFEFKKSINVAKDVGWLIPGLNIKRWLALLFLGSIFICQLSFPSGAFGIFSV